MSRLGRFSQRNHPTLGVLHIVENPRGSLFWRTTAWLRTRGLFNYTSFQACAYGGRRPKHTALAFTHPAFAKFCRSCPNCPDHLPWGLSSSGWATSEEAVYPIPFCEQVAATLVQIFQQPSPGIDYHQLRASTGLQPKASKSHPVVPEHKRVIVVRAPSQFFKPPCLRMERLDAPVTLHSACQCELRCLPSGAQLLRLHSSGNEGDSLCVSVWGIPHSPSEFIEAALRASHPGLAASDLPSPLAHAIEKCSQSKPEVLAKERTNLVRQWATRAHALEEEERAFKQSLHPEVAKILAPKRGFFCGVNSCTSLSTRTQKSST